MNVLNFIRILICFVFIICNIQIYTKDSTFTKQWYEKLQQGRSITAANLLTTKQEWEMKTLGPIQVRSRFQIIVRIILYGSRVIYWMYKTFYLFIKHGFGYYSTTSTYELIKTFVDVRDPFKDLIKLIRHEGRIRGYRLTFLDHSIDDDNDEIN